MQTLIAILKLIPVIVSTVQALEAAVPLAGQGKAKLDLILATVSDVYTAGEEIRKEIPQDKIVQLITQIVSRVVGLFNALGIFKKGAA